MGYGYNIPLDILNKDKKNYLIVWMEGVTKERGRFVKRTVLDGVCKKFGCSCYEICKNEIQTKEDIQCIHAWKMTIGKGKKAY